MFNVTAKRLALVRKIAAHASSVADVHFNAKDALMCTADGALPPALSSLLCASRSALSLSSSATLSRPTLLLCHLPCHARARLVAFAHFSLDYLLCSRPHVCGLCVSTAAEAGAVALWDAKDAAKEGVYTKICDFKGNGCVFLSCRVVDHHQSVAFHQLRLSSCGVLCLLRAAQLCVLS